VIANGIAASGMPAFSRLSEATTWQLVAFVRTLGGVALDLRSADAAGTRYVWDLPPGFPRPKVPADNPMSTAKVELGRHLFYDTRLSVDGTFSCASCHEQRLAFTDGKARAVGVTGEVHPRSSMGLANIAYSPVLTWANPTVRRLEAQALVPMFGEDPVELGLSGLEAKMLARLEAEPRYGPLFAAAFPGDPTPVSLATVTRAIASFERSLLSGRTPYDRYRTGADPGGISASAKRGEDIFFSERTECFHCHGGFNFTETVDHVGKGFLEIEFHNTGLYNLDEDGAYPPRNTGVHGVSDDPEDMGRFKAQHRPDGTLHARRQHRDPARGGSPLRGGRPDRRRRPLQGRGREQPAQEPVREGVHVDGPGARRPGGVPRESHGYRLRDRPAACRPLAPTCPEVTVRGAHAIGRRMTRQRGLVLRAQPEPGTRPPPSRARARRLRAPADRR
jgi:cytochrome c peroxidase